MDFETDEITKEITKVKNKVEQDHTFLKEGEDPYLNKNIPAPDLMSRRMLVTYIVEAGVIAILLKMAKDDKSMLTVKSGRSELGGIDLTSDKALSVQNNGQGIKFHIDPAQLAQLQNAPGFVPVIINIQPLKSLSEFLGLNQPQASTQLASAA